MKFTKYVYCSISLLVTVSFSHAATFETGTVVSGAATEAKPQSKCWYHDGSWWTVLADREHLGLFQYQTGEWTRAMNLDDLGVGRCDCLPIGDDVYVLAFATTRTTLHRLSYVGGVYQFAPGWEIPVELPLMGSSETATIARDTTGRLWMCAEESREIRLYHSLDNERTWTGPVTIRDGVSDDDISAVAILNGGRIGVMWSDQNRREFGFAVHTDGDAADEWGLESVTGDGPVADDHLNLAVASDGTLYAAVKTEFDTAGMTQLGLLRRSPDGEWSDVIPVTILSTTDTGTRPIVVLNEARGELYVFFTNWADSPRSISVKSTTTGSPQFHEDSVRVIQNPGDLNDVSSTRQNVDNNTGLMVIASAGGSVEYCFIREFSSLFGESGISPKCAIPEK
ncbi:MAG: hypothetical protein ABIH23_35270 [bacterium]